jgi:hypothetical protein
VCARYSSDVSVKILLSQVVTSQLKTEAAAVVSGSHLAQDGTRGSRLMPSNLPGNDGSLDSIGASGTDGGAHAPVLWRFLNGPREAFCLLHPHPIGFELRYMLDGVQLIGVVSTDVAELRQRAEQWRGRLVLEGWAEVEARVQPFGRVRVAGR